MALSNFSRTAFLGGAALLLVSTGAFAGVQGSRHDLGASGNAQQTTSLTGEVCVFCHTPHGADTGASAPLWNKRLQSGNYTRYSSLNTSTLDGSETAVGSVSLACLSCHDGTQAMDVVINRPGSGGWNSTGTEIDPIAIGTMSTTPVPNLTQDLSDDHPISIEYAGGACGGTTGLCSPAGAATGDPDFNDAQFATINANPAWWVDVAAGEVGGAAFTGNPGARDKTDMVLYTRTFTNGAGVGPSVECASCHDPHNDTTTPVSFLRIDNDTTGNGSAICLACHIK